MPMYTVIVARISSPEKGVLRTFFLLCALVGITESSWFDWKSTETAEAGGDSVLSGLFSSQLPLTAYQYPCPVFVIKAVTAVVLFIGNNDIIEWNEDNPWIYAVICVGALGFILKVLSVVVFCCYCCCRGKKECYGEKTPSTPKEKEDGNKHQVLHPSVAVSKPKRKILFVVMVIVIAKLIAMVSAITFFISQGYYQIEFTEMVSTITPFISRDHHRIYTVVGVTGFILLVVVAMLMVTVVFCCYCCRRQRSDRPTGTKKQKKPMPRHRGETTGAPPPIPKGRRVQKERDERETANKSVKVFVEDHKELQTQGDNDKPDKDDVKDDDKDDGKDGGKHDDKDDDYQKLPDMGSRMQKYWFRVKAKAPEGKEMIVTSAPVSQKCPLRLDEQTLKGINELLQDLKQHPYLHVIEKMGFIYETQQVVILQPYMPSGSLKDLIYEADPDKDWSKKYSRRSKGLSKDTLRHYGRQILEAMTFLYSKGFPMLGHVQSGNIFVDEKDVCKLGGYENTIVGYKTRLYRLCRNNLQHFDVIMFGHLIFEMSCGYELTQLRPGDAQYGTVSDSGVKEILEFIFTEGFTNTIEQIKKHQFFSTMELPQEVQDAASKIELKDDVKKVLRKVSKGKSRDQPSAPGGTSGGIMDKIKHSIMWLGKEVSQSSGAAMTTAGTSHGGERRGSHGLIGKLIKKKPDKDDEKAKVLDNENEGEQESSQGGDRKGKGLLGKFIKKKPDLDNEKGRQLDNKEQDS